MIFLFYFICNFFVSHVTLFPIPKKFLHIVRNKLKKKNDNWLKNKKVIQSQKIFKKPKIVSFKIHKGAEIFKNRKTFLNKGTKHKKIIWKV